MDLLLDGTICNGFSDGPLSKTSEFYDVVVPEGITEIAGYAFASYLRLRSISLPSTLKRISASAFKGSGLKEVRIPASVQYINHEAFSHCRRLTKLVLDSEETIGKFHKIALANSNSLREIVIEGALCPVLFNSYDETLIVRARAVKYLSAEPTNLKELSCLQEWYNAFMSVPTEDLLHNPSVPIPVENIPSLDTIKALVEFRLKGLL